MTNLFEDFKIKPANIAEIYLDHSHPEKELPLSPTDFKPASTWQSWLQSLGYKGKGIIRTD